MRALLSCRSLVALSLAFAAPAIVAQAPGGLYIAGDQFDFEQAAQTALAENAGGQRYYVLVLAPASQALSRQASGKARCSAGPDLGIGRDSACLPARLGERRRRPQEPGARRRSGPRLASP